HLLPVQLIPEGGAPALRVGVSDLRGERTSEAGARDILALPLEALEGEGELLAGLARLGAHVAAVAEGAVAQGPADHVVDETLRDQRLHAVPILGATDLG